MQNCSSWIAKSAKKIWLQNLQYCTVELLRLEIKGRYAKLSEEQSRKYQGLTGASKGKEQEEMPFPHLCIYFNDKQKIQMRPGALILMGYTPKPRLWGVGKRKADRLRVIAYYIWKDIPV